MKEHFTTPVGRFVQGDFDTPQDKDAQGNPRVIKTGPNAGQPNPQFFAAVAFPKADPHGEFAQFHGMLERKAAADFPNLFPNAPTGDYTCVHPQFSFKVIDGDGRDQNGKLNSEKPGFAGNWVVRFASGYPPRIFDVGHYAAHEQIQEKGFIKRGHFVRVSGTVEGNGNAQRPGLYLNLSMVERTAICRPEDLIVSGPDAGEAFGSGPVAALPPGAVAAPAGGAALPPVAAPPVAAPPVAAPPVATAAPYAGYMDRAGNSVAAPAASPAPPVATPPPSPTASPTSAPARTMLPAANGATYEAMIAAGWTDETLVQHGMMAAG